MVISSMSDTLSLQWSVRRPYAGSEIGCDLIFADPDNGIRTAALLVPAHRTKAVKYPYLWTPSPSASGKC